MKRTDVKVGNEYLATIKGKRIRVRIEAARSSGGWDAINLATNLRVRITSPNGLKPIPAGEKGEPDRQDEPSTTEAEAVEAIAELESVEPTAAIDPTPLEAAAGAKKLSAIEAAVLVLAAANGPLTTRQMIEAMAAQGLWTSPGGKTPSATLYSAILREITQKGDAARFIKTAAGQFTIRQTGV